MKKNVILFAAAAALLVLSCAKEQNPEPINSNDSAVATYTLTVDASKGADTKALAIDGNAISATWADGETVSVYNSTKSAAISGTLAPVTYGLAQTKLTGTLTGTIEEGDVLVLTFRSDSYDAQDGTLDYIAANCDYATASITASFVDAGNKVTSTAPACFKSHQTIVKFTLEDEGSNAITPDNVVFKHGAETLTLSGIPAATYSANGDGVLYVAIPGFASETLSMTATTSAGDEYIYQKDGVSFADGTYHRITVRMYNERTTPLTFEAMVAGAQVTFTQASNANGNPESSLYFGEKVQYSTDGIAWNTYPTGTPVTLDNVGDKVMFRGKLDFYATSSEDAYHAVFTTSADCYIYGNMMSLLADDSFNFASKTTMAPATNKWAFMALFKGNTHIKNHSYKKITLPATVLAKNCYSSLFQGCTGLTSAPELPATTLAEYCYSNMFNGCSGLTSVPASLPAMTLQPNCYRSMFYGCTSLSSAPALPATTLASNCYYYMFQNCSGLSTAPDLPAETLKESCYAYMFDGCSSLSSTPALNATTLANYCYLGMFRGCTGLISAAASLPATSLCEVCYCEMFSGCTNLTSAPILPAENVNIYRCYKLMFNGCTNLESVTCLATSITGTDAMTDWLKGVKSTGIIYLNSSLSFSAPLTYSTVLPSPWSWNNNSSIPTGWTVQKYLPKLMP